MKEINIEQATAVTSPDPLMLLCTTKENGSLNMAPVSFFMYSSYNPPMLAFAMGKESNSGPGPSASGNTRVSGGTLRSFPPAILRPRTAHI